MLPHSGHLPLRLLLTGAIAGVCSACEGPPRSLARPNRVAVAADGTVWVSDFQHDRLVRWSAEGAFQGTWGQNGLARDELWRVTAMVATPEGLAVTNLRPVSNALGAEVVTELKILTEAGVLHQAVLDGRTLSPGARVDGMTRLPGGHLVLADSAHGELLEVDTDGQHIGRFGSVLRPDAEPFALTTAGDDVWMVERDRHRITVLGTNGQERTFVPADGPLKFPSALAVCASADPQWVVVADFGNHRVRRFLLDGTPLTSFAPHPVGDDRPVQLLDLALSADCGELYLVDSKGDRVLVTDLTGTVLRTLHSWEP